MSEEILRKQLTRAMQKVLILEQMTEDTSRRLFLEKERLKRHGEFLNNILESLTYPFYVIDTSKGTIKIANSAAKEGDRREGQACYELIYKTGKPCEGPEKPCPLVELKKTGKPAVVEHIHHDENNGTRHLEVHAYPVSDGDENAPLVIEYMLDITERKRAEECNSRQLEKLAALRTIDLAISSSQDLSIILSVILDRVTSMLAVDAADVLLYRPHLQVLEYAGGKGFHTRALQFTRLKLGESYAGRAALERRTIHLQDLKDEGNGFKRSELLDKEGFATYFGVPLIAKGSVKGVLEVFNRSAMAPDNEWLDFLNILAGQIAIALDSVQLFDNLERANVNLVMAYDATIDGWARALELRDRETEGHSRRVTDMTLRIADAMGISEEKQADIRRGALLHDIGKMAIPDSILLKSSPLDEREWEVMRRHPEIGYNLLLPIDFLKASLDIPYCHHEKWDGTGYPRGLKGEQIPLAARIFAVVDIYDALGSKRPYRPAWPREKILEHISSIAGSHLDPTAVEVFFKTYNNAPVQPGA
jgi:HD-GYP domain-containing protein (c-di-GMP phosphodiesterase class II)